MFVICTYDVNEKRCDKVKKLLRQYLFHTQKSVFEGELTPAQLKDVQEKLRKMIQDDDNVHFYYSYNNKQIYRLVLDKEVRNQCIID